MHFPIMGKYTTDIFYVKSETGLVIGIMLLS